MSMIPGGGDAINEDDLGQTNYELLAPEKGVKMQWVDARVKYDDNDSTYCRVSAMAELLDGNQAGRKMWEGWTLSGNGKNTEVANRIFNQACFALGLQSRVSEPEQLLNIPFVADIKVNPAKNGYEPSNGIQNYKKFDAFAKAETKPAASGRAAWKRS